MPVWDRIEREIAERSRVELEAALDGWMSDNFREIEMGGIGDAVDLYLRLCRAAGDAAAKTRHADTR